MKIVSNYALLAALTVVPISLRAASKPADRSTDPGQRILEQTDATSASMVATADQVAIWGRSLDNAGIEKEEQVATNLHNYLKLASMQEKETRLERSLGE